MIKNLNASSERSGIKLKTTALKINSKISWLIVLAFLTISSTFGQDLDKIEKENLPQPRLHSPKKATLYSLVPGLGQIYNKKYWKLPIVYAGFGVTGYFAITNGQEYSKYNEAYKCAITLGDECTNELALKYDSDDLKTIRDYYRRNMELSYIIMGVWYVLQMLDATVDAHLYYWEVDDNLSVRVDPMIQPVSIAPQGSNYQQTIAPNGLRITVSF